MNVNEILERVVHISHNEDGPDTGLREKAVGWLNSAFDELVDEMLPWVQDDVSVAADVVLDAGGEGVLPAGCRRVVAVLDNGCALERLNRVAFEQESDGYFVTGSSLSLRPAAAKTVRVIYVPVLDALEADGEIPLLDTAHHNALVWGALVWGSTYERAFSAQGDLRLFEGKWQQAKQQIKMFYAASALPKTRVTAQNDL